jgi:hypothetical protein
MIPLIMVSWQVLDDSLPTPFVVWQIFCPGIYLMYMLVLSKNMLPTILKLVKLELKFLFCIKNINNLILFKFQLI